MGQAASDRLAQADSILRDALDLPAEERARIVRERCGSDAALGDSLIRLIANFDQLGTFLEQPAFPLPAARREISPGTTLGGRFRVVSDRKSTRLNSSHLGISYAVFCLKK